MSGSSSGRSSFQGGSFGASPVQDCSRLNITTSVVSPSMIYFGGVSAGIKLVVDIDDGIVVLFNGVDVVGSVNPPRIQELIKCLEDGHKYEATISTINGAHIQVIIQSK